MLQEVSGFQKFDVVFLELSVDRNSYATIDFLSLLQISKTDIKGINWIVIRFIR